MCMCIWWEEEIEIIVGHDFLACVAGFSNGNVGLVADLDNIDIIIVTFHIAPALLVVCIQDCQH